MKIKVLFYSVLVVFCLPIKAQVLDSVTVSFQKTMFVKNILKENEWIKKNYSNLPESKVEEFVLIAKSNTCKYFGTTTENISIPGFWNYELLYNQIEINKLDSQVKVKKNIFGKTFNIKDTVPEFKWKMTNNFRDFIGYQTRQAETIIFDSVKVIAYYCPKLTPSFGPDIFNGLPGTILAVFIPDLHINWIATKVSETSVNPPSDFMYNKKSKYVNQLEFQNAVKSISSGKWPSKKEQKSWWNYTLLNLL